MLRDVLTTGLGTLLGTLPLGALIYKIGHRHGRKGEAPVTEEPT